MLGFNVKFKIVRINYAADDEIGGAITTGTTVLENLDGRIEATLARGWGDMVLLANNPGLQTERLFTVTMQPGNQDIRERDYFVITEPVDHQYYNDDMRIIKVNYSNFIPSDPRDYMILTVARSVVSHTVQ